MKWTERYKLLATDTDLNNTVTPSAILRYMQDTANRQMEGHPPTYDELIGRGLSFVLSRIRLSVYSALRSHDEIVSETWVTESRGVTFNRCHRILRDGVIAAEAAGTWALIGIDDHRLHRVSEFDFGYEADGELELDVPARLRIPEGVTMTLAGERTVEYADADVNGHMNNTRYPDLMCGWASDMRGRRAVSMGINFVHEAPVGCALKVYRGVADETYYVRTVRDDGQINAEAEIVFEDA